MLLFALSSFFSALRKVLPKNFPFDSNLQLCLCTQQMILFEFFSQKFLSRIHNALLVYASFYGKLLSLTYGTTTIINKQFIFSFEKSSLIGKQFRTGNDATEATGTRVHCYFKTQSSFLQTVSQSRFSRSCFDFRVRFSREASDLNKKNGKRGA